MYIPVDREISLEITSVDVNHSFWVPKLAGKTDAINNHPNRMWIKATSPGTYEGQCAEFCGLEHSAMRFRVIALEQPEFDAWVTEQQQLAAARQQQSERSGIVAGE
jgi:cytochrome c oxidase subunit 2